MSRHAIQLWAFVVVGGALRSDHALLYSLCGPIVSSVFQEVPEGAALFFHASLLVLHRTFLPVLRNWTLRGPSAHLLLAGAEEAVLQPVSRAEPAVQRVILGGEVLQRPRQTQTVPENQRVLGIVVLVRRHLQVDLPRVADGHLEAGRGDGQEGPNALHRRLQGGLGKGGLGDVELLVEVHLLRHGVHLPEVAVEEVHDLPGHDGDRVPVQPRRSPAEAAGKQK